MGDDGTSLGAAFLSLDNKKRKNINFKNVYLGYKEKKSDLEKIIEEKNIKTISLKNEDISTFIAEKLADGKIVAIFQDRAEFGPRALGNRTILAPATQESINDGLNKKLSRTEFMPFAPVIRDIDSDKYFKLYDGERNTARFMTITCYCTNLAKKDVPAVVHKDKTARPQIVYKYDNKLVYDILTEYSMQTNIFALVNTSFNIHEEPIVNSYEDAIKGFFEAGLDYLYIDGKMISMDENKDIYVRYLIEKIHKLEKSLKEANKEKGKYLSFYENEQQAKERLENQNKELQRELESEQQAKERLENQNKELQRELESEQQAKEQLENQNKELQRGLESEQQAKERLENQNDIIKSLLANIEG